LNTQPFDQYQSNPHSSPVQRMNTPDAISNTNDSLAILTHQDSIVTLTINRPESRNALSTELLAAMHARVDELGLLLATAHTTSATPTVLILTGAGKSFCAGMDLKLVLGDPQAAHALLFSLAHFCLKLRALPIITLAKVNGAAIGGGCGLTTVCDISITYADAKLGFPEVDLGVCPAVVAPWLVRKIGSGPARHVLLTGGLFSGIVAHERGIVDHLVPAAADLDAAADDLAKRLSAAGAHALRGTKSLLNTIDASLDKAIADDAAALSAKVLQTPETQAMLRAKLAK